MKTFPILFSAMAMLSSIAVALSNDMTWAIYGLLASIMLLLTGIFLRMK